MFLVFGKNSNGRQPALVMAGAMLFYSGTYTAPALVPIESWQCVFDESNWDNAKIEEGNWTLGLDERNWKEPE